MEFYQPELNDDETIRQEIAKPGKQVMFLQADWCGDCKAIKPFVKDIKKSVTSAGINWFDADRDAITAAAKQNENVQKQLDGAEPKKVIVVPGKLVNFVV